MQRYAITPIAGCMGLFSEKKYCAHDGASLSFRGAFANPEFVPDHWGQHLGTLSAQAKTPDHPSDVRNDR